MSYIVIGAGAGGLVVAIGLAAAKKDVTLVERGLFGGDCTNFGCVPSKSLISSAHMAHAFQSSEKWGVVAESKKFQAAKSLARVREIVTTVRSHEEPETLEKLGVKVCKGAASFVNPHTLHLEGVGELTAKKIIIATGSKPKIPSIPGLSETPFLTNETIFSLEEVPESLICIGGGPIGCELAQAFSRLGCRTTIIHHSAHLLSKESPFAAEILEKTLQEEGLDLALHFEPASITHDGQNFTVTGKNGEQKQAKQLLISLGREPHIDLLRLENAGINYSPKGIAIDPYGRTSQKHIYALGDAVGAPFFTHKAEFHGRTILQNLLLPWNKRLDKTPIPRTTFTDPEIASIGLSEKEALEQYSARKIHTYRLPFAEVDRAICAGRTDGGVEIVTKKWSSKILGCTIVGERAGEMLAQITLAMETNTPLRKLSGLIHPYPTYSRAIRKTADKWLKEVLLGVLKK